MLPQDVAPDAVAGIVEWIKSRHPVWDTPLVLHTGDAVADALNLLPKRAHGTVVVVDDAGARSERSTRRRARVSTGSPASPTCSTRRR